MKKHIGLATITFALSFSAGWLMAIPTAECRMCNSKKCFYDADCGRLCTCVFEGGKGTKKGLCMQVGD